MTKHIPDLAAQPAERVPASLWTLAYRLAEIHGRKPESPFAGGVSTRAQAQRALMLALMEGTHDDNLRQFLSAYIAADTEAWGCAVTSSPERVDRLEQYAGEIRFFADEIAEAHERDASTYAVAAE